MVRKVRIIGVMFIIGMQEPQMVAIILFKPPFNGFILDNFRSLLLHFIFPLLFCLFLRFILVHSLQKLLLYVIIPKTC